MFFNGRICGVADGQMPIGHIARDALPPNSEIGEHTRPRVLLDAPRVQPLACVTDKEVSGISTRPIFSARARKTAPEAGALPILGGEDALARHGAI